MTTEDDFQQALAKSPRDWQTLLVFADWLQERGDKRAEGYRALGVRRAAPADFSGAWVWLNAHPASKYANTDEMRAATLPDDWYDRLTRARNMPEVAEERRVLRLAFNDAARAFAKLPPDRRAELLALTNDPPRRKRRTKTASRKK